MDIKDLADNIKIFTKQFEAYLKRHGAYDKACSFKEGDDCRKKGLNICNTPACHGGEIAIMYDELEELSTDKDDSFYQSGADELAENLGFEDHIDLIMFFKGHQEYWGGEFGYQMFCSSGEIAFGKEEGDSVTLREILDWWKAVVIRLEAVNSPKDI